MLLVLTLLACGASDNDCPCQGDSSPRSRTDSATETGAAPETGSLSTVDPEVIQVDCNSQLTVDLEIEPLEPPPRIVVWGELDDSVRWDGLPLDNLYNISNRDQPKYRQLAALHFDGDGLAIVPCVTSYYVDDENPGGVTGYIYPRWLIYIWR